jgi:hypothetical protein
MLAVIPIRDGSRPKQRRRSWVVGDRAKGEQVMSEASAGGGRAEMERRLVERSLQDESFRQRLLDEPKGAIEGELGTQLRESIEVRVVEESADTIYLVLPSASPLVGEGGELSDEELDAVAGGFSYEDTSATICSYPPCF